MYDKLMVVAHPDDEIIFGGGELIKEKGWKVICVTNRDHPIRSVEFKKVMELVGADFEIWNYKDCLGCTFDEEHLGNDLRRVLNERSYRKIVTHNLQGDYGHTQHICLSEIMYRLVKQDLYVFKLNQNMLPFGLLQQKMNLLSVYKSQVYHDWFYELMGYVVYEGIEKVI